MTKEITLLTYQKIINLALDYIRVNLRNSLTLRDVASIANMSPHHFHRIFKTYVGESLDQYIRRLRLELAASLLQTFQFSLSEIARHTGYSSQQSLQKAFKKHFGEPLGSYKSKEIHPYKRLLKEQKVNEKLIPTIKTHDSIDLLYLRIVGPYDKALGYHTAWDRLLAFTKDKGLDDQDCDCIGISLDDPVITKEAQCRFYACVPIPKKLKPEGPFGTVTIHSGKFAVFLLKGPHEQLHTLYQAIYFDWLPSTDYTIRSGISFEKYLNDPKQVGQGELRTEVYIPIH